MSMGKNWCFTDFDVTEENYDRWVDLFEQGKVSYLIIGKEVCPETTRLHFQGFCVFTGNKRMSGCKKVNAYASWRLCKGTAQQNITYCSKGGEFSEWGTPPLSKAQQGLRDKEKWLDVIRCAKEGTAEEEYPREYIMYNSTLKKMLRPEYPEFSQYSGVWFYGPTESGKSRRARAEYPGAYLKQKNKWWDNYEEQENVLIDDMTPDHEKMVHFLLNWVDHYPFQGEYKGGSRVYRPKNIIVTSNYDIGNCFPNTRPQTVAALERRFTQIFIGRSDIEDGPVDKGEGPLVTLEDQICDNEDEFTKFMNNFL